MSAPACLTMSRARSLAERSSPVQQMENVATVTKAATAPKPTRLARLFPLALSAPSRRWPQAWPASKRIAPEAIASGQRNCAMVPSKTLITE